VAGTAELHQMVMDAGVMRMRAVAGLDVKPGDRLVLKPGAYHVMLTDLKRPLQAGETFPLTLRFAKAGSIEVSVEVESMAGGAMHPHTVR
jgi:copper(I)-binding protein